MADHHRAGCVDWSLFFFTDPEVLQIPYNAMKLYIPLSVKLHHACTDPFVLDLLLQDFQQRMLQEHK